jgi:hypothetical protein
MGILSQFDTNKPDIVDEIEASADNQLVISRQYKHYSINGVQFADPQWDLEPLQDLLVTMSKTSDFGTKYDYMPDKMSFDIYGTHELWPILLKLNNATDRSKFVGPKLVYIGTEYATQLVEMLKFGLKRAEAADAIRIPVISDLTIKEVYV